MNGRGKPIRHGGTLGGKMSVEYRAWAHMLERCSNPTCASWMLYGGRGITVCERWRDSYQDFLDDMGPRPSTAHSLDRIDNDGDYTPTNCRWATQRTQMRNTSRNRRLTHDGLTLCLYDWAARLGLSQGALRGRLRRGLPVSAVLAAGYRPRGNAARRRA